MTKNVGKISSPQGDMAPDATQVAPVKPVRRTRWSSSARLAALHDIHQQALRDGDQRIAIAAITEANRMQGSHAGARADQIAGKAKQPRLVHRIIIDPKAEQ